MRRFRQFVRSWLGLPEEAEPSRAEKLKAIVHEGAILGPEGKIENFAEEKDRICIGCRSYIRGRLLTYGHGGRITLGERCYVGIRSEIWSMESIRIGNRVLISHDVNIHDGTGHSLDAAERAQHFARILESGHPRIKSELPGVKSAPIVIEDDVWISFGVTILKGVRIGAGSVIGARAIVTEDVPPGVLYTNDVKPLIRSLG